MPPNTPEWSLLAGLFRFALALTVGIVRLVLSILLGIDRAVRNGTQSEQRHGNNGTWTQEDRSRTYQEYEGERKESESAGSASDEAGARRTYYCQVMGVDLNHSPEQLHAAYRDLMKKYHPDAFATAAPEFQELATRKTQEINEAYNFLTKG